MSSTLSQTPLFAWHAAHGGRMVDFAGWAMPVQYESIVAEHLATRRAVGLFDVSHMGRFRLAGPGAEAFLDGIVTRRVAGARPGQVRYALVTNDAGGILDDVLVYRLQDSAALPYFLLVVNASNRQKIWGWLETRRPLQDVELTDQTLETAMVAVQGPQALEIVRPHASCDVAAFRYYTASEALIDGAAAVVSRTGYTGEDGCELIVPAEAAEPLWRQLIESASALGGLAAGLGSRDTLRLEAGMPLYGHELSEDLTPLHAGLEFAVNLEDRSFPGRDSLARLQASGGPPQRRIGLLLSGRRAVREGYDVLSGAKTVGRITSGTFSPTFKRPIAMAYVERGLATPGTSLDVDIRGQRHQAQVVELPFYRRTS